MIQCNHSPIYDDNSVMGLLGITESDLKSLRDNGLLGYSRHGDKYFGTPKPTSTASSLVATTPLSLTSNKHPCNPVFDLKPKAGFTCSPDMGIV